MKRITKLQVSSGKMTKSTINLLTDDLLAEILLRLPNAATLARAALTSKKWLSSTTDADFLRRFHLLHPTAPLLGFFAFKRFFPIPQSDPDLTAATGGIDSALGRLEGRRPRWGVLDCDGSRLLLERVTSEMGVVRLEIAVYDLMSCRFMWVLPRLPHQLDAANLFSCYNLLPSTAGDDCSSFGVLALTSFDRRDCADVGIFWSDSREWQLLPLTDIPSNSFFDTTFATRVNRSIYWPLEKDDRKLLALDMDAVKFSTIESPTEMNLEWMTSRVVEAEEGGLCIVELRGFVVTVWFHEKDSDRGDRWVLEKRVSVEDKLTGINGRRPHELAGVGIGFVFLRAYSGIARDSCWFLSLHLKTMKLEKIFYMRTFVDAIYPCIVVRPPLVVPGAEEILECNVVDEKEY